MSSFSPPKKKNKEENVVNVRNEVLFCFVLLCFALFCFVLWCEKVNSERERERGDKLCSNQDTKIRK